MINLARAEAQKVLGNGLLASFTLWVYPVAALVFVVIVTLLGSLTPLPTEYVYPVTPWDETMTAAWTFCLTGFPASVTSRLLAIGFIASFFAGEYEWRTWKNIVPRRRRAELFATKSLVLSGLLVLSIAAASLIWGLGMGVYALVVGQEYGPALSRDVLGGFLPEYVFEAAIGFEMALLLCGFCALAALLTRSIVGALLLGMGISIVESISGALFRWAAFVLDRPGIAGLYAYMPTYNLDNLRSWFLSGSPVPLESIPGLSAEPTLVLSAIILALWIMALLVLSALWFQHQDLSS